jgi:hypothetical protein
MTDVPEQHVKQKKCCLDFQFTSKLLDKLSKKNLLEFFSFFLIFPKTIKTKKSKVPSNQFSDDLSMDFSIPKNKKFSTFLIKHSFPFILI